MPPHQTTVCVVDDDASVLKSIRRLFLSTNLAIRSFEDPAAFLDYAKGNPVDLAILDIRMPGPISGLDLQRRLQKLHPSAPDPIITANWNTNKSSDRWVLPLGGGVRKMVKIGSQPVNFNLRAYYNVIAPDDAPNWSMVFTMQFLFPKS